MLSGTISSGTSSSRLSQFGLYRTIDARTEDFLKLSRKRQIRQGCICASISTIITVTIVIGMLLIFEYHHCEESAKDDNILEQQPFQNIPADTTPQETLPVDIQYKQTKVITKAGLDKETIQLSPMLLNMMNQNRGTEAKNEVAIIQPIESPRPKSKESYVPDSEIPEFDRNWLLIPSFKTTSDHRAFAVDFKSSMNNIDYFNRIRKIRDYQRIVKFVNRMMEENLPIEVTTKIQKEFKLEEKKNCEDQGDSNQIEDVKPKTCNDLIRCVGSMNQQINITQTSDKKQNLEIKRFLPEWYWQDTTTQKNMLSSCSCRNKLNSFLKKIVSNIQSHTTIKNAATRKTNAMKKNERLNAFLRKQKVTTKTTFKTTTTEDMFKSMIAETTTKKSTPSFQVTHRLIGLKDLNKEIKNKANKIQKKVFSQSDRNRTLKFKLLRKTTKVTKPPQVVPNDLYLSSLDKYKLFSSAEEKDIPYLDILSQISSTDVITTPVAIAESTATTKTIKKTTKSSLNWIGKHSGLDSGPIQPKITNGHVGAIIGFNPHNTHLIAKNKTNKNNTAISMRVKDIKGMKSNTSDKLNTDEYELNYRKNEEGDDLLEEDLDTGGRYPFEENLRAVTNAFRAHKKYRSGDFEAKDQVRSENKPFYLQIFRSHFKNEHDYDHTSSVN